MHEFGRRSLREWAYDRWLQPLVARQISLTLIRWREAGNLFSPEEPDYIDPGPDPQHVDPEWLDKIHRIRSVEDLCPTCGAHRYSRYPMFEPVCTNPWHKRSKK